MASDTRLDGLGLVSSLHGLSITQASPLRSSPKLIARSVVTLDEEEEDLSFQQSQEHEQEQEQEQKQRQRQRQRQNQDQHQHQHQSQSQSRGSGRHEQEPGKSVQELPSSIVFPTSASAPRPHNPRRATDPITPLANSLNPVTHLRPAAPIMGRSRNRSPYSRNHLRSRSSNSSLGYSMARAYSSPISETLTPLPEMHPLSTPTVAHVRPASPMDHLFARRASPRRSLEEPLVFSQVEAGTPTVPTIEEHAELSLRSPTSTPTIPEDGIMPASPQPIHSTFPRSRRRPSSPLYSFGQPPRIGSPGQRVLHTSTSTPVLSQSGSHGTGNSSLTSPLVQSPASRYNEAFPISQAPTTATAALSSASSVYSLSMASTAYSGSMPSTPTSIRSRSPSVSSLGTIPDSPDAEEEAMERERQDAHERLERLEKLNKIVGNRDSEELGRRMLGGGKERKRWSVCGAERRGDLEMETIWED